MKLEELVLRNYVHLNETDLAIWQYISSNKKIVAKTPINTLAQRTNVSRTTISRFVRKIGLEGYSEFKVLLQLEANHIDLFDDQVYDTACNALIQYIEEQKRKNYDKICKMLYESKKIFVYGTGDIQNAVAKQIKRMFVSCHELVYDVDGSTFDRSLFDMMTKDDMVIIISLSGNNAKAIDIAKRVKLQNVKLLSITEFKNNTLAEISDERLYIMSTMLDFIKEHPNYKMTMIYFVLVELLFIKYTIYKKNRLFSNAEKELL